MKLIVGETVPYHVSHETVMDMERAILADPSVEAIEKPKGMVRVQQQLLRQAYRVNSDLANRPISSASSEPLYNDVIVLLMGATFEKCWPAFSKASRKHMYIFDAWPAVQDRVAEVAEFYGVDTMLFPSKQVAQQMGARGLKAKCIYMPEAIEPAKFHFLPSVEKDIDLLHFGRRFNAYHQQVVGMLEAAGAKYLYEESAGSIIFPDEASFVNGLARSKISLCVPANITHPEKVGGVETMTQRYLQTMLAKAVPLGRSPRELIDLFGYDPVIRINEADPVGQVEDMLANMHRYQPLIERNYQEVLSHHTWAHRWQEIQMVIEGGQARKVGN